MHAERSASWTVVLLLVLMVQAVSCERLQPYMYSTLMANPGAKINGTRQCFEDDYRGTISNGTMSGGLGKLSDGVFGLDLVQSGSDCETSPWVGWRVKGVPLTISFRFCGHMQIKTVTVNMLVLPEIRSSPLYEANASIVCENGSLHRHFPQESDSSERRVENITLPMENDNSSICWSNNGSMSLTLSTKGKWLLLGEIEFEGEGEICPTAGAPSPDLTVSSSTVHTNSTTAPTPSDAVEQLSSDDDIWVAVGVGVSLGVVVSILLLGVGILVRKKFFGRSDVSKKSDFNYSSDTVRNGEQGNGTETSRSRYATNPSYSPMTIARDMTSPNRGMTSHNGGLTNPSYSSLPRDASFTKHHKGPMSLLAKKAQSNKEVPHVTDIEPGTYDEVCLDDLNPQLRQPACSTTYDDVCPDDPLHCAKEPVRVPSYDDVQPVDPSSRVNTVGKADSYDDIVPCNQVNPNEQCDLASARQYETLYNADHASDPGQEKVQPK